ncbi:hypothetical protein E1A34_16240 [Salmonella enterica subsp. enterica serovar Newport]|uniref:Uncharacterized protein n=1 Tax=Salmonella newport TaxID=108619 RepID=A0A5Y0S2D5_SALNE|nr:hypothetical protein [Salmonella enterica]ECB7107604.1 hypothetical protein [Salmonella enterica subsp. enterica serovar Newport]ECF2112158.1 hypothetical protein [Salmonella enterica subsp. enterica serovar Newport]ECJ3620446.1 hypothetical protein [Salmonella enterica subsp. enterica serovar Newport]ECV7111323.1 hypothetical protein [Salmonella enterica subsp. enterica serovar Newport]
MLTGAQNTLLLAETAPDIHADFLCPSIENSMVGRAANTIPAREICPPTSSGFERPTTLSKGVNSKYLLGHKL